MDDRGKLLRILSIELQDLIEDCQVLMDHIRGLEREGKTTTYVATANIGLLTNEIEAVRKLMSWLEGLAPTEYDGVTALQNAVVEEFRRITKRHEFPESIYRLVRRKVEKLGHYIWEQTVS